MPQSESFFLASEQYIVVAEGNRMHKDKCLRRGGIPGNVSARSARSAARLCKRNVLRCRSVWHVKSLINLFQLRLFDRLGGWL